MDTVHLYMVWLVICWHGGICCHHVTQFHVKSVRLWLVYSLLPNNSVMFMHWPHTSPRLTPSTSVNGGRDGVFYHKMQGVVSEKVTSHWVYVCSINTAVKSWIWGRNPAKSEPDTCLNAIGGHLSRPHIRFTSAAMDSWQTHELLSCAESWDLFLRKSCFAKKKCVARGQQSFLKWKPGVTSVGLYHLIICRVW